MIEREKTFNRTLGNIVKYYRRKKNISQHALASMLFLSRSTVVNFEYGHRGLTSFNLFRISKILDIDLVKLFKVL